MKATAVANSNIALVKYWGNRDPKLVLPHNSSISFTLDKLYTTTTVEFSELFKHDSLKIDGKRATEYELNRVTSFLNLIRKNSHKSYRTLFARIESVNNFPKAAGLASSASAFAALALAATRALGFSLCKKDLSILARQGSGSAARSIDGGFIEWIRGRRKDGKDSYARVIAPPTHWKELKMIVAIVDLDEKRIKSKCGMKRTVRTSPFYPMFLRLTRNDLIKIRHAILKKDFSLLGQTAELNTLKMHATMLTSSPHLLYWAPQTIAVMKEVIALRDAGVECYFTIDAGPQVKLICLEENVRYIISHLKRFEGIKKLVVCSAGPGVRLDSHHLF